MRRANFRDKLLALGITLTAVPLILFGAAVWYQNQRTQDAAAAGCLRLAEADLDHISDGVYSLCESSRAVLEKTVRQHLKAAGILMDQTGGAQLAVSGEGVNWEARNQITRATSEVMLPRVLIGRTWLGLVRDPKEPVAVVDDVQKHTGATSTIFQRMNAAGDMLRAATNVIGDDGKRAIGTFIPASGADGQPNPVVSAVLHGQTYVGRAFVVNAWYMAAYEPLLDHSGSPIGMLYVGVPESLATENLRKTILNIKIGETGYVYVLNASGATRGRYVISKDGTRDGADVWDSKDSAGNLFIQEICRKAVGLGPRESAMHRYPWKNPGDASSHIRIAHISYFKPWDWVIATSVPEAEVRETVTEIERISSRGASVLLAIGLLTLIAGSGLCFVMATRLTGRTSRIVAELSEASGRMSAAAAQVSQTSQHRSQDAMEQATSNEQVSTSLEELAGMTQGNLDHSRTLKRLAAEARGATEGGVRQMESMKATMNQIQLAGADVVKINKVIDEIAFQTNILALNAAVEAARAGEAGLGFAVVAGEVRGLARRCSEAAQETSDRIQKSMSAGREGVAVSAEVAQRLAVITASTRQLDDLVQSIASASERQNQGIAQINSAASRMGQRIRSAAANAEEEAGAADQFSAQAQAVEALAAELGELFGGKSGLELR